MEALRTWEEYVRFEVESSVLARELKEARHRLGSLLGRLGSSRRLAARDAATDVGTSASTRNEYHRSSLLAVARAAAARAQQAIRCLEEYSKIATPDLASHLESLRYRLYDLEASTLDPERRRARLQRTRLCLLITCDQARKWIVPQAERWCRSGVGMIQLRDKQTGDREQLEVAKELRHALPPEVLFIVNDRPDLARLSEADGVHLGQDDFTAAAARIILGPARLIGVSTHDVEQLRQAAADGADYVGFGPVFPTATKEFDSFVGPEAVAEATHRTELPLFAIGGIDGANASQLAELGCDRVAVSSAIWQSPDPLAAAKAIHDILTSHTPPVSSRVDPR